MPDYSLCDGLGDERGDQVDEMDRGGHCHRASRPLRGADRQAAPGRPGSKPGGRRDDGIASDAFARGPDENDALIAQWPHGQRGAPVWHTDEPIDRLARLCDGWGRVCIGSSAQHSPGSAPWRRVMDAAMNRICQGRAPTWLHMLRGLGVMKYGHPFASVDSTDVARNHNRPHNGALAMAQRWDRMQCNGQWTPRPEQLELVA